MSPISSPATEILAPAGNLFKLKTAVRYGADAVYLGGRKFGLRSGAQNFSNDEILEGCRFAHRQGAKVYIVLNAFLFDDDMIGLPEFLQHLETCGVDALIISDLGVIETVRAHCNLTIHLSTQASVLNSHAARFWRERGVSRIVLGREVSIEAARKIRQEAAVEVELFGHGAMCMAYSGHCTISNYTAGRDSNRGGCIQSCRFKYGLDSTGNAGSNQGFFLSSKDLNGIARVGQFTRAGIDSLKIEGRMKSALYVATTVRAYVQARNAALEGRLGSCLPQLTQDLASMSHRDYTEANLIEAAGVDSIYSHDHQAASHELAGHVLEVYQQRHLTVHLKNRLLAGEPITLLGTDGNNYELETRQMRDLGGNLLERAQPNRVVLLPHHSAATPGQILRKLTHAQLDPRTTAAS